MNLPIKAFSVLLLIFSLTCTDPKVEKNEKLKSFLWEKGIDINQYSSILVLTEESCPACSHSFASLLEKQIENKKSLLIISARGTLVDISMFLKAEAEENILYDWKLELKKLEIHNDLNAIFLDKQGAIDTIVAIRAKGLQSTLAYISNRLEE